MKTYNVLSVRKLALLTGVFCAVMFTFDQNASADRHPLPPARAQVPDGGTTIMLLGTALGALGVARRFLKK